MQPKKILLSAYSCSPTAGSEPGIGWNWAQSIAAEGHDVTVITRSVNRANIEEFCAGRVSNPKFVFHDLPTLAQKIYRLPLGNYFYYLLWQYTAAERATALHDIEQFDQVQHVTWGSFRAPSFMGKLGIPFLFGPVGGGEDTPTHLRKGLGWRGRLWDSLRRISNGFLTVDPLMRSTYSAASEILASTPETLSKIPAAYRPKARVQPAAGICPTNVGDQSLADRPGSFGSIDERLQILYVGRLVPWKGLHFALRAVAALGETKSGVRLTVIGEGYDASRLKRMASRLGLDDVVTWIPWMPRDSLLSVVANFDLFLFPSLHDSGGMAVLEAMSFGLPVVCLDLGGPSEFVNDSCGRIASTNGADEDRVVEQIAAFLSELVEDPGQLERLSEGARRRAKLFTWEANVRNVYGESLMVHAD